MGNKKQVKKIDFENLKQKNRFWEFETKKLRTLKRLLSKNFNVLINENIQTMCVI